MKIPRKKTLGHRTNNVWLNINPTPPHPTPPPKKSCNRDDYLDEEELSGHCSMIDDN